MPCTRAVLKPALKEWTYGAHLLPAVLYKTPGPWHLEPQPEPVLFGVQDLWVAQMASRRTTCPARWPWFQASEGRSQAVLGLLASASSKPPSSRKPTPERADLEPGIQGHG